MALPTAPTSYNSNADLITLATALGLAWILGVGDSTALTAASLKATMRVDSGPYQGCKIGGDGPGGQEREFPRLPLGRRGGIRFDSCGLGVGVGGAYSQGSAIWDLDRVTNLPVVPYAVLCAHAIETNAIGAGDLHTKQRRNRKGLLQQSTGSQMEQYTGASAGGTGALPGIRSQLCQDALDLLEQYLLTSAELL